MFRRVKLLGVFFPPHIMVSCCIIIAPRFKNENEKVILRYMTPLTHRSSTELKFTAWHLPLIRPAAKKQRAVPTTSSQQHTHSNTHVNVVSTMPATKIGCHFNQLGVKGQRGQIPDPSVRVMVCGQCHSLHPDPHKQSHRFAFKPHTIRFLSFFIFFFIFK